MAGVKGKSGRKKKPLREKQIIGVKKDRLNDNAPDLVKARIERFENLGELGQKIFEYYEPMLYNNGTLSAADAVPLFMLCKRYEDWYTAMLKCEEKGKYIPKVSKEGITIGVDVSPWAKLEKQYFDDLLKVCREFGLTPVTRGNIEKIKRGEDTNPFAGIM